MRFIGRRLAVAAALFLALGAGGAKAALLDGSYLIDGVFDVPVFEGRRMFGAFDVVAGDVVGLSLVQDWGPTVSGVSDVSCTGSGEIADEGDGEVDILMTAIASGFGNGSATYLILQADGRFYCSNALEAPISTAVCTLANGFTMGGGAHSGDYSIELFELAAPPATPVPAPPALVLSIGGLAVLMAARRGARRRRRAES